MPGAREIRTNTPSRNARPGGAGARLARRAAPGALLILAFLAAALTPCPPRVPITIAHVSHPMACHEQPAETFLTAPCACGCEAHAPIAGGSARLGAVLPSNPPGLAPRLLAE